MLNAAVELSTSTSRYVLDEQMSRFRELSTSLARNRSVRDQSERRTASLGTELFYRGGYRSTMGTIAIGRAEPAYRYEVDSIESSRVRKNAR